MGGVFKRIEVQDIDLLKQRTDSLDKDQRLVIDLRLTYAKDMIKAKSGKISFPTAPLVVVQGGAGSGKSHVIDILSQWIETVSRSRGDNPEHPYVLKCAFAGTAAAKISGQTLTSAFNIGFGNKFQ